MSNLKTCAICFPACCCSLLGLPWTKMTAFVTVLWKWGVFIFFHPHLISAWPAGTWWPTTWGWDFGYPCRSCTLSPVLSITVTLETATLSALLIAQQPAISPPCLGCPCGRRSLTRALGATGTSSSATSGWLALLLGCWSSDIFCWGVQWEEGIQLRRSVWSVVLCLSCEMQENC